MNYRQPALLSGVLLVLLGCTTNTDTSYETIRYGGKIYRIEDVNVSLGDTPISSEHKFLFCGPDGVWTLATSKEAENFEQTVRRQGKLIHKYFKETVDEDAGYTPGGESAEGKVCRGKTKEKDPKLVTTTGGITSVPPVADSPERGGD